MDVLYINTKGPPSDKVVMHIKGLFMRNKNFEVTEFNYNERLETTYFSNVTEETSIRCTNPECNNPKVLIKFNSTKFSCIGKEKIGRSCMRLFLVKPVN